MNLELQPRTVPTRSQPCPLCVFTHFNCPELRRLTHAETTTNHTCCNQPALPARFLHPNHRLPVLQKQPNRMQRP